MESYSVRNGPGEVVRGGHGRVHARPEGEGLGPGLENSFFSSRPGRRPGARCWPRRMYFSALKCPSLDMGAIEAPARRPGRGGCRRQLERGSGRLRRGGHAFKAGRRGFGRPALADLALHPPALIHFSSKARDYFGPAYPGGFRARAAALTGTCWSTLPEV